MRFMTVSKFREMAELGEGTQDTFIDNLLSWISAAMEKRMDRWILKKSYTEILQPEGSVIWLRAYPVDSAVPYVISDYNTSVPTIDIYSDYTRGKITRVFGSFYSANYPTLSVTYTGGYPQVGVKEEQYVQVPDDMVLACFLQAAYYYNNRKDLGSNNMSVAGVSVSVAPVKWLPQVEEILQSNTRMAI